MNRPYRNKDYRNTSFTDKNAWDLASLYLGITDGDPRVAKLRAISMWYSLEFTMKVQRAIERQSREAIS